MNVTTFDIIILSIVSISALLGLYRGCVYISVSISGTIASIAGAYMLYPFVESFLSTRISNGLILFFVACVLSYLISYITTAIIASKINSFLSKFTGGAIDKLLGLIIGMIRGIAISVIIFTVLSAIFSRNVKISEEVINGEVEIVTEKKYPIWLGKSITLPYLEKFRAIASTMFSDKMPKDSKNKAQSNHVLDIIRKKYKNYSKSNANSDLDKKLVDELNNEAKRK